MARRAVRTEPPTLSRGLTREFRLVAACCLWPPSDGRDARIRTLAAEPLDWSLVMRLAVRHRVEGLVSAAFERAGVQLPAAESARLAERARAVAQRSLAQAAESARLQALFDGAGLANLLLKGAAVEALAYGALGRKDAWDIDLLVDPTNIDAAIGVLADAGYEVSAPTGLSPGQFATFVALARECELQHAQSGQTVELHWGLADGPVLLPGLSVGSPSQDARVGSLTFRALARDELVAYLCVHGAMHGWARLKWLADLAALIAAEDDGSLAALVGRARALGAGAAPDQALALIGELFAAAFGPKTRAALRSGAAERWLTTAALRVVSSLSEPADDPRAGAIILISQFIVCGGWRGASRQLSYRSISIHDRVHLPLPPALGFLYPLLRAPLWLGRRLGELRRRSSVAKLRR